MTTFLILESLGQDKFIHPLYSHLLRWTHAFKDKVLDLKPTSLRCCECALCGRGQGGFAPSFHTSASGGLNQSTWRLPLWAPLPPGQHSIAWTGDYGWCQGLFSCLVGLLACSNLVGRQVTYQVATHPFSHMDLGLIHMGSQVT